MELMKLSEGVEWGLHCGVLLAALPPGAVLSGSALAEFHGVSESYLLKHLQALVRRGLFESVPGPKGGFRLARAAQDITLLDLVLAIDGPQPAFRCTEIRQRGPAGLEPSAYPLPCAIHATMRRAEHAWREVLRGQTLADLAGLVAQRTDPRALARALPWLEQRVRE
jgi:Rrf2 family protein